MRKEVCNCCGRTHRCSGTVICSTCHSPMCPDCFRDYGGACCIEQYQPSRQTKLLTKLYQSQYALQQRPEPGKGEL